MLRKALLKTIERINALIKEVVGEQGVGEEDSRSLLNFAVTDGVSVVCSRYVSSTKDEAASLFFSSGTSWKELGGDAHRGAAAAAASVGSDDGSSTGGVESEDRERNYVMERRDKGSDIVLVASEPLTFERGMLTFPFLPLILFICFF